MPLSAAQRLVRLLAGGDIETSHSASLTLPADALTLSVEGLGPIPLPIRAPQARRLATVARPAVFGRGDETLLDTSVRDTWELSPDRISLGGADWPRLLDDALDRLGLALGIPAGARLRADLHSMLVYGKGQFFAPHQDSEKHDAMIATLVVSLPSAHTGGELVVDDRGRLRRYAGSRDELVLVAFYADRQHEVRRVRSGHRVTLTFDLLLTEGDTPPPDRTEQAAALLMEYFTTPQVPPYGSPWTPRRLAALLDHEYSQRSLSQNRLKGRDAERVALLRAAAELARAETVLAQADLHETRDAPIHEDDLYEDDWFDGEDADDPGPRTIPTDDGDAGELIDEDIRLGWWTDTELPGAIELHLMGDEVIAPTPSSLLKPYASEYEGYMGNYGNTIDRWYARAALVIWPREHGFAVRAEADAEWALRTLRRRIDAEELDAARAGVSALKPFWRIEAPELLDAALDVAAGVDDAACAGILLTHFPLETLSAEHAHALADLARQHDAAWWESTWHPTDMPLWTTPSARGEWVANALPSLAQALRAHDAGELVDLLARWAREWLAGEVRRMIGDGHPARREKGLSALGPAMAGVLVASDDAGTEATLGILGEADDRILPLAVSALRVAAEASRGIRSTPSLVDLARLAQAHLREALRVPTRADDDWSIVWDGSEDADAQRLAEFLRSPTTRTETWPLAKDRRQRIHQLIDDAGLPVRHTTTRTGRPYKLVLEKTTALFTDEKNARRRAESDLAWIDSTFGALSSPAT